jgi:uncharacterized protein (DUF736 family)
MLDNIYAMLNESRMRYGIEICDLGGGWKETGKIRSRFFKIILEVPRFSANNVAELELGRESRRGKFRSTIAKY